MEELKEIITNLGKIKVSLNMDIPDEVILEQAVKIFISNNIQNSKNKEPILYPLSETASKVINKFELATQKQINLIKKLNKGIVPAGITKQEARKLIEEKLR